MRGPGRQGSPTQACSRPAAHADASVAPVSGDTGSAGSDPSRWLYIDILHAAGTDLIQGAKYVRHDCPIATFCEEKPVSPPCGAASRTCGHFSSGADCRDRGYYRRCEGRRWRDHPRRPGYGAQYGDGFGKQLGDRSQGLFVSPPLPPGNYDVEIQSPGFKSVVEHVRLEVGQRIAAGAILTVGANARRLKSRQAASCLTQNRQLSPIFAARRR